MIQPSTNELQALHRLVSDVFSIPANTQLLAGRLPDQLPVELPIPEEAQLLGSLVAEPDRFEIFFDVALSLEQVRTFYRQQLLNTGWEEQELTPPHKKGFMVELRSLRNIINRTLKFRHESQKFDLGVQVNSHRRNIPGIAKLHLTLVKSPASELFGGLDLPPFPLLEDPLSVTRLNTSGGNEMGYASNVHLETELELQALISHYEEQFEAVGWTKSDSGQNGALMWIRFSIMDHKSQPWLGWLNITKLGGVPNQYLAYARAVRQ